jgi:predicted XRE-type DNA-binding protein
MKRAKKDKLAQAGRKRGTAAEFLHLTPEEELYVELKASLSQQVERRREESHRTQEQVARLLTSSQSRVAKMEKGDCLTGVKESGAAYSMRGRREQDVPGFRPLSSGDLPRHPLQSKWPCGESPRGAVSDPGQQAGSRPSVPTRCWHGTSRPGSWRYAGSSASVRKSPQRTDWPGGGNFRRRLDAPIYHKTESRLTRASARTGTFNARCAHCPVPPWAPPRQNSESECLTPCLAQECG